MNSSDCVANENEWSDSEGKRERSSPKAKVGEPGAVGVDSEGCLDTGGVLMFSEAARWDVESCLWLGCWRMRRRPDDPRPCSCSGTMGDLEQTRQLFFLHTHHEAKECPSSSATFVTWLDASHCCSPCHAV